ncbi:unnamed protein product [Amoebophrya sp. A120]|nr:unnamed protein product [Amoebophrya sp. A120]|eukprot:GSA120T00006531001.1
MPILVNPEFQGDLEAQHVVNILVGPAGGVRKTLRGFYCPPAKNYTGGEEDETSMGRSTKDGLVLVFPNYAGLKTWDREVGAWVSRLGYHALVCDYYTAEEFPYADREAIEFPPGSPERKRHFERGMRVMNDCLLTKAASFLRPMVNTWLREGIARVLSSRESSSRAGSETSVVVSTLGYCLGGVAGLELWRSGAQELDAVVSVHGVLQTKPLDPQATAEVLVTQPPGHPEAPKPGVKILLEHGESDHLVPEAMVRNFLGKECKAHQAAVTLHAHPDTPHGFALPLGVGNAAFPDADRQSCRSILEFWRTEVFREVETGGAMALRVAKTPAGVPI